jgi:glycosyltransferase involved in cell wall biosynthesis
VWKEVRSLADAGYAVALRGCRYEIDEPRRTREGSIDVLEIPFGVRTGRPSIPRRVGSVLRLWNHIVRTPARVYHAHNIHVGAPALLASRLRRAKLVYDAHELYGEVGGTGLLARAVTKGGLAAERIMVRRSDAVITTNESRAKILRERHGERPITILRNVPAVERDVLPVDPGYPTDRAVLLYQGGIYATARAFRETIEALRELPGVDFVILGFGRESEIELIKSWSRELGVAHRVHVLPPRPFDELVGTAAAATVGIVPIKPVNLGSFWGDTNKLYEYLMAGLPVVASDLPEIRPTVTAGDPPVGELFDPSSPSSIAAAVRRVIEDPATYRRRREEARRLALERFNWGIEEQRLLALYDGLRPSR